MPTLKHDNYLGWDLGLMAISLATCTLLGEMMRPYISVYRINIAMVYVLGVVVVAAYRRTRLAFAMPIIAMVVFIWRFVPPEFAGGGYAIALAIMFIIASLISGMANRIRQQNEIATRATMQFEKEKLRNALLSSVSHDLRTPLAAIAGAASSLNDGAELDEDVKRELSQSIYLETQRLNLLLRNLLDMTRVESETIVLSKDWHSIEELIGASLSQHEKDLAHHNVSTQVQVELPLVKVDDTLISIVLANLIENAGKYVKSGNGIKVWAKTLDNSLAIGIDSEGIELSNEDREHLFEKFYRGSNVGTVHGTGLGLSICKAIVELHGGTIKAEQLNGGGTSFWFTLPLETNAPNVIIES